MSFVLIMIGITMTMIVVVNLSQGELQAEHPFLYLYPHHNDGGCEEFTVGVKAFALCEYLGIVGLDLAELVHELELVHPDVPAPIPRRKVLPVRRDPDASNPVSLVVQRVLQE